jgi:hypothetical protein
MPKHNKEFGRILSEVITSEIPIQYVSAVTVLFKNGKTSRLTRKDLANPLPLDKNLSWDKVADSFSNVDNVEIHIDLDALEKKVTNVASTLFKKHFNNDGD